MSLGIIWAYAFLLTAAGAYNYSGCSVDVPSSNIISDKCRKHVFTMMQCRTDVSVAMKTASWFSLPYPFQWGIPVFHWKTACIMIVASIIASIDSVRQYVSNNFNILDCHGLSHFFSILDPCVFNCIVSPSWVSCSKSVFLHLGSLCYSSFILSLFCVISLFFHHIGPCVLIHFFSILGHCVLIHSFFFL